MSRPPAPSLRPVRNVVATATAWPFSVDSSSVPVSGRVRHRRHRPRAHRAGGRRARPTERRDATASARPVTARPVPRRRRRRVRPVIELDGATVLLQWAPAAGCFSGSPRRREVGLGYGWLQRLTFLGLGALVDGSVPHVADMGTRDHDDGVLHGTGVVALVVSIARKSAGVAGQREVVERGVLGSLP